MLASRRVCARRNAKEGELAGCGSREPRGRRGYSVSNELSLAELENEVCSELPTRSLMCYRGSSYMMSYKKMRYSSGCGCNQGYYQTYSYHRYGHHNYYNTGFYGGNGGFYGGNRGFYGGGFGF